MRSSLDSTGALTQTLRTITTAVIVHKRTSDSVSFVAWATISVCCVGLNVLEDNVRLLPPCMNLYYACFYSLLRCSNQ